METYLLGLLNRFRGIWLSNIHDSNHYRMCNYSKRKYIKTISTLLYAMCGNDSDSYLNVTGRIPNHYKISLSKIQYSCKHFCGLSHWVPSDAIWRQETRSSLNRDAGDLTRHRVHFDVIMLSWALKHQWFVTSLMSLTASPIITSRMKQCLRILTDICFCSCFVVVFWRR